jgi:hypothetical protein
VSLKSRIEALEAAAGMQAKTHFIWAPPGTNVKTEIAARIAAGTAQATDRFYSFSWRPPGRGGICTPTFSARKLALGLRPHPRTTGNSGPPAEGLFLEGARTSMRDPVLSKMDEPEIERGKEGHDEADTDHHVHRRRVRKAEDEG